MSLEEAVSLRDRGAIPGRYDEILAQNLEAKDIFTRMAEEFRTSCA